jgi:hypothetical protein
LAATHQAPYARSTLAVNAPDTVPVHRAPLI